MWRGFVQELQPQRLDEAGHAEEVLRALNDWGSEGRRILRGLLGRWLDDHLVSGPKKRSQDQAHRSTRPPGLRDAHTRPE